MAQPNAHEQYLLELANRFRLDPAAEYDLLVNSGDVEIENAIEFFDVDLSVLLAQWADLSPAQPLAWSTQLHDSATAHNQLMIDFDQQSHDLPGEPGLIARINDAGPLSYNNFAENVYAFARSPLYAHAGFLIDWGDTATGIQVPTGHRDNLISNTFRETGFSILTASSGATSVGPLVVTQHFANRSNIADSWLLGVAFRDFDDDDLYSVGEGLEAVTVDIVNSALNVNISLQTEEAGGYQALVPQGSGYEVTFTRAGSAPVVFSGIDVFENVKQDYAVAVGALPAAGKGKITGIQFDDVDGDGKRDAGEAGIAGRELFLDANGNRQLDGAEVSVTTDAEGIYIFNDLPPGDYAVTPVLPAGRSQTSPDPDLPLGVEVYQLDDGLRNGSAGSSTGDILLLNAFDVVAGQETLNAISLELNDLNPSKLFVYQDADGDDAPNGNEKILELNAPTWTGNAGFVTVAIPETTVSGTFFVAAQYEGNNSTTTFIPVDDTTPAGDSWFALSSDPNSFTAFEVSLNWMLRANTTGVLARPVTVLADGTEGGVNFGDYTSTLTGTGADDALTGTNADDTILGLGGNDTILGLGGSDTIVGSSGNDDLFGGTGEDDIVGGSGNDEISGGAGNDSLNGGGGDDTVSGDDGDDTLRGGAGNDDVVGGAGEDKINGGNGNDYLYGEGQRDTIDGVAGNDRLFGGGGDDRLRGGNGRDFLFGEADNDGLVGGNGVDDLNGGPGNDRLDGNGRGDLLIGGLDDDSLRGQAGDDTLIGVDITVDITVATPGSGEVDRLLGGLGADTFVLGDGSAVFYTAAGNGDYGSVLDFDAAENDVIQLMGSASSYSLQTLGGNSTNIFFEGGATAELIGVVKGAAFSDFSSGFSFV